MAENVNTSNALAVLSLCATTSDKLKDISIKNGQLIFVHNTGTIVMDLYGKRTFYNQVIELETEQERINLSDAINGKYYFVIEEGVFWRYFNGWIQLTTKPEDIVFIGTELPALGQKKTLYVNKDEREISIWDEEQGYTPVSNYTGTLTSEDILAMF